MGVCHSNTKKNKKKPEKFISNTIEIRLDNTFKDDKLNSQHFEDGLNILTNNKITASLNLLLSPSKLPQSEKKKRRKTTKTGKKKKSKKVNKAMLLKKKSTFLDDDGAQFNPKDYEEYLTKTKSNENNLEKQLEAIEYDKLAEEFGQIKEIVDRKIKLLEKKGEQLNMLQKGVTQIEEPVFNLAPPPKFANFITVSNILDEALKEELKPQELKEFEHKIVQKKEKLNIKKSNLNTLSEQLQILVFTSANRTGDKNVMKSDLGSALAKMSVYDKEIHIIHKYQKSLSKPNSIASPVKLRSKLSKKASCPTPGLIFNEKNYQTNEIKNEEIKNEDVIEEDYSNEMPTLTEICKLIEKIDKKTEKIEEENKIMEDLNIKLQMKEDVKEVVDDVKDKIVKKIMKIKFSDIKTNNLDDSNGVIIWSDGE